MARKQARKRSRSRRARRIEYVERKLKQWDPVIVAPVYLTVVGLLRGVSAC